MNIRNTTDARARQLRLWAVAVVLAVTVTPLAAATVQHEGHNMPMPAKPKAKPAAKRKTPAKAAPRRTAQRRTTRRRRGAQPSRPAVVPAAQPAAPTAVDPHAGHTMTQPSAAPTPQPTGAQPQQHQGHQMPMQPQATPTPARSDPHAGHVMPSPTSPAQQQQQPAMPMGHDMSRMSQPMGQEIKRSRREVIPAGPVVRLEDLEKLAAERNPTLAQSDLVVRAAEGRRRQAGLFPNPVVGYTAEELAFRAPSERGSHGFFVEQAIPLGGKLGKAKRVFASERDQATILAEAQRTRVLNSVRVLYYDALGAQRLVELRDDLSQLAREAVEITKELYNVGQADRPDQLEIEIEAERAEIDFLRARTDWEQSWRALSAVVGDSTLKPARLADVPVEMTAAFDEEQLLATLLRDSPEIKGAQAGLERARAALSFARSQRVPDLFVRGGIAYNKERLESDGRKIGKEGVVEVGVSVPIFNRNQGGVAAAEAELGIAEREQQRLQLSLRSRFASGFREYRNARQTVESYRTRVVPKARQAYDMYLSNFRQMAASYPQVLIAQRTLFQVEVEYARALVELRRSAVGLRGFLLDGGLDAVGRPGESGGRTEGFKLRGANDASGDSDNR